MYRAATFLRNFASAGAQHANCLLCWRRDSIRSSRFSTRPNKIENNWCVASSKHAVIFRAIFLDNIRSDYNAIMTVVPLFPLTCLTNEKKKKNKAKKKRGKKSKKEIQFYDTRGIFSRTRWRRRRDFTTKNTNPREVYTPIWMAWVSDIVVYIYTWVFVYKSL